MPSSMTARLSFSVTFASALSRARKVGATATLELGKRNAGESRSTSVLPASDGREENMGEYQLPSASTMFFFSITGRMARDMATNCPPSSASTMRQSCGAQAASPRQAPSARQAQNLFIIVPSSKERFLLFITGSILPVPPGLRRCKARIYDNHSLRQISLRKVPEAAFLSRRPFSIRSADTGKKVRILRRRACAHRIRRARTTPDGDSRLPTPPGEREA